MILFLALAMISYLVGALPTGYWYAKYCFGVDVTAHGSGNIGATNVARVLGSKKHFALIFLLDFLKAYAVLALASYVLPAGSLSIFALAALLVLGNAYSIFLGFRGGKGVATTVGILAAIAPATVLALFLVIWVTLYFWMKQVDLASLVGLITASVYALYASSWEFSLFMLSLLCFVVYRHRSNIKKYLNLRTGV